MFYEPVETTDKLLRLGDVVRGYISPTTKIKQPFLSLKDSVYHNYEINVQVPRYSVVLTPCCSIGDTMVCLTPLVELPAILFKNPYFVEDFTRIDRAIEPQKAFAPTDWDHLSPEKQEEILAKRNPYTLLYMFIYAGHDLLPAYEKKGQTTNCYMIDFRNVQTLRCDLIKSRDKTTEEHISILESKCLQLAESAREDLRNKLSYYYGRPLEAQVG